jgi:hypothetical protein
MFGSVIVLTPSVDQRGSLRECGWLVQPVTPSMLTRRPSDADRVITQNPEPLVFRFARVVFRRGPRINPGILSAGWGGAVRVAAETRTEAVVTALHDVYRCRPR